MKVKVYELWKYKGCSIYIDEDMSNEYLPKGNYNVIGKVDWGIELYFNGNTFLIEEYTEEDEVDVYINEYKRRVDILVEAYSIICLNIAEDGLDNFDRYLHYLSNYKKIQSVLYDCID